jgi:P27 family predicted phage terminase small subunit
MVRIPAGLDGPAKTLWKAVVSDLAQREVWRDVDASAVQRYVVTEQIARQALARLAKRAQTQGAEAYRSRGSHNGVQVDVDLQIWRNATRDAAQFAFDLGLSPRARRARGEVAPQDELTAWLAELNATEARH